MIREDKLFCHRCGGALIKKNLPEESINRLFCAACKLPVYENPVPATAAVAVNNHGEILLVKRKKEPGVGLWSLPGGFQEYDETPEQCCLRELKEETGLDGEIIGWAGNVMGKNPFYKSVLVMGYRVTHLHGTLVAGDDSSDARFFKPHQMPPLAFRSHQAILMHARLLEDSMIGNLAGTTSIKNEYDMDAKEASPFVGVEGTHPVKASKKNADSLDSLSQGINRKARLGPGNFGAYVITSLDHLDIAVNACKGGAKIIQYREKNIHRKIMLERAKALREITRPYNTLLIINDYIDIALLVEADGVHLGQDDIPLEAARRITPPGFIIGISTHSLEQAIDAEIRGADYIGCGPVFATPTKEHYLPIELEIVKQVIEQVQIPVVTIGGLNLDNLHQVKAAGAINFAMVRAFQHNTAWVVSQVNELASR